MIARGVALLVLFFGPSLASGPGDAPEGRPPDDRVPLAPGTGLEREMAGGEVHRYALELAAGENGLVSLERRGIEVELELTAPDGRSEVFWAPIDRWGRESLLVTAETGGGFLLEVRALEEAASTGRYRLELARLAAGTPDERRRIRAEAATTRAARLHRRGDEASRRRAVEEYGRALSDWRALGRDDEAATALYAMARLAAALGENREAIELYRQALTLRIRLADDHGKASILNRMGLTYRQLGDAERARRAFENALELATALGDRFSEAALLNNLGLVAHARGDLRGALDRHDRARRIFRELGEAAQEAAALVNLARLDDLLGEPESALESYRRALELERARGDRLAEARILNGLGVLHRGLGETQTALELYGQALERLERTGDREWRARVLNNLGVAYYSLGQERRSLAFYRQALPLRREVGDRRGEAATLVNLGRSHAALGNLGKALEAYRQALRMARSDGRPRDEAVALDFLGQAYAESGRPADALDRFDRALDLAVEVGDRRRQAAILLSRSELLSDQGRFRQAAEGAERATELFRMTGSSVGVARGLVALARAERGAGRPEAALARVEAAVELLESLRTEVLSPDLRASFFGSEREAYELYVELLMERHRADPAAGHDTAAFEASERARARTLVELLQEAAGDLLADLEPELRERRARLQRRASAKARRHRALVAGGERPEAAAEAADELEAALVELDLVEARIRRLRPDYAELIRPRPLDAGAVRRLLDEDTLLLHYALGPARSFLWAVSADSLHGFELPAATEIESAARRAHARLATPAAPRSGDGPPADAVLSRMVLGPVADRLGARRLAIVADGALHYVPFQALPVPDAAGAPAGDPLLLHHEIVNLPSASALAALRREQAGRPPARGDVVVLADPVFDARDPRTAAGAGRRGSAVDESPPLERLPFTRREAESIAAVTPDRARLRLGLDASRATLFGEEASRARVLHLATHGVIDATRAPLSGLALSAVDAEGRPRSDFLRLYEIYDLRLDAELVVLSGCRTALGEEIRGEGLVGLTRGFMYAGAPRVVASLWQVQDRATAELMARFYRALQVDGRRPAAALRAAQLEVRAERKWRHPYFWAAFVLEGDWH